MRGRPVKPIDSDRSAAPARIGATMHEVRVAPMRLSMNVRHVGEPGSAADTIAPTPPKAASVANGPSLVFSDRVEQATGDGGTTRIDAYVAENGAVFGVSERICALRRTQGGGPGGTIDDLVAEGVLHEECSRIFRIGKSDTDPRGRPLLLHRHQREAILEVAEGRSCVLTTGTGSGKSLAFIVPIVDHVLRNGSGRGIRAIVVYPMNALANSQGKVSQSLFGVDFTPEQVIGETLERATPEIDTADPSLRDAI